MDQAAIQHEADVGSVLRVSALDLGQRLRVEVVVVEGDLPFAGDEYAALLPAGESRQEVCGRDQLDVQLQLALECR
jgi:hypothetical protein